MKEGKLTNIIAVPTSIATKNQAEGEGEEREKAHSVRDCARTLALRPRCAV